MALLRALRYFYCRKGNSYYMGQHIGVVLDDYNTIDDLHWKTDMQAVSLI